MKNIYKIIKIFYSKYLILSLLILCINIILSCKSRETVEGQRITIYRYGEWTEISNGISSRLVIGLPINSQKQIFCSWFEIKNETQNDVVLNGLNKVSVQSGEKYTKLPGPFLYPKINGVKSIAMYYSNDEITKRILSIKLGAKSVHKTFFAFCTYEIEDDLKTKYEYYDRLLFLSPGELNLGGELFCELIVGKSRSEVKLDIKPIKICIAELLEDNSIKVKVIENWYKKIDLDKKMWKNRIKNLPLGLTPDQILNYLPGNLTYGMKCAFILYFISLDENFGVKLNYFPNYQSGDEILELQSPIIDKCWEK
jgi:hypothetical protein